jgi:hypothetical protein
MVNVCVAVFVNLSFSIFVDWGVSACESERVLFQGERLLFVPARTGRTCFYRLKPSLLETSKQVRDRTCTVQVDRQSSAKFVHPGICNLHIDPRASARERRAGDLDHSMLLPANENCGSVLRLLQR